LFKLRTMLFVRNVNYKKDKNYTLHKTQRFSQRILVGFGGNQSVVADKFKGEDLFLRFVEC